MSRRFVSHLLLLLKKISYLLLKAYLAMKRLITTAMNRMDNGLIMKLVTHSA